MLGPRNALLVLAASFGSAVGGSAQSPGLAAALERASDRAAELRAALDELGAAPERAALEFLIANMPARDLRSLDPGFLVEDVRLARQAWLAAPWHAAVPEAVFLDAILPYAHLTETREPWRARLREISLPLVEGCATSGEAAQRLNAQLFAALGVRYSTARERPDQSASETIDQGIASCTGLSILLASACRSVGVPARVAGIAEWPNKRGNHTWVEVWDGERWRFTGAAEHDPAGLDRAWFVADAALATSAEPRHAIWAAVWRRTGMRFPVVWAPDAEVWAVDVTERYAGGAAQPDGTVRLMVDVYGGVEGPRVAAEVECEHAGAAPRSGLAKDASADTNDHLEFLVPRGMLCTLRIRLDGSTLELTHTVTEDADHEFVSIHLPEETPAEVEFRAAAAAFFAGRDVEFSSTADELVAANPARARAIAWSAYRAAPIHAAARAGFDARVVRTEDREAPYTVTHVGERPAGGWALFIAMHGGGGVPKHVNDSQWRHMQRYYRERPEAGGYVYVALRAPNDEWNGFYDDAICPLVAELVRQFLVFGDVNSDAVFAIGYSHGGYGAFVIGPKMPDRFAAVHASAAAPTPNETVPRNLRNLRFSFMVGTEDTAYGRIERCDAFWKVVEALREADPTGYPVTYDRIDGNGHTGLPDRDHIAQMRTAVREPMPRVLSWRPTDGRLLDRFWLSVDEVRDRASIDARLDGGMLELETDGVGTVTAWLDARLLGESETLTVRRDGSEREIAVVPRARTLCESIARRGDPRLAGSVRVEVGP